MNYDYKPTAKNLAAELDYLLHCLDEQKKWGNKVEAVEEAKIRCKRIVANALKAKLIPPS